jgi:hypothetical protein
MVAPLASPTSKPIAHGASRKRLRFGEAAGFAGESTPPKKERWDNRSEVLETVKRYAIAFAAWLPFFAIWVFFAVAYAHFSLAAAFLTSLFSMGSASLWGVAVWHFCQRRPLPRHLGLAFYLQQLALAGMYSILWNASVYGLESIQRWTNRFAELKKSPLLGWQLLTGVWLYGLFAGVAYAVQTRSRLHEKEVLAAAARLEAIRARLNPHFLFNALHTIAALVKLRPAAAEGAIERLGDMLRYALKEDGRELVEFGDEYDFTRQYIAFEQLRYEDRLKVDLLVDPESFEFEVPPFSIQTLAENAVRHAISIRPQGGAIWIRCACHDGQLNVSVRDDGPGVGNAGADSHHSGLRSLKERLLAAYGPSSDLRVLGGPNGFEVSFVVPFPVDASA